MSRGGVAAVTAFIFMKVSELVPPQVLPVMAPVARFETLFRKRAGELLLVPLLEKSLFWMVGFVPPDMDTPVFLLLIIHADTIGLVQLKSEIPVPSLIPLC